LPRRNDVSMLAAGAGADPPANNKLQVILGHQVVVGAESLLARERRFLALEPRQPQGAGLFGRRLPFMEAVAQRGGLSGAIKASIVR
jgi:hypothetical protein